MISGVQKENGSSQKRLLEGFGSVQSKSRVQGTNLFYLFYRIIIKYFKLSTVIVKYTLKMVTFLKTYRRRNYAIFKNIVKWSSFILF